MTRAIISSGDLRWVPLERLVQVFYVGRKTAKQILGVIEMLEGENQ